jgi:hypothetical protein
VQAGSGSKDSVTHGRLLIGVGMLDGGNPVLCPGNPAKRLRRVTPSSF